LQCINPRDLFDSSRFFMDQTEYSEGDDSTEQEDRHLVGGQSYSKVRSRNSSTQPSPPPASSEYDFHANHANSLEDNGNDDNATAVILRASLHHQQEDDATLVAVGTVKLSLNSLEDDGDATVVSLQSRKSPSHEQKYDATTVPVQSREGSSQPQDDDATMVPVHSREGSSHPQDDDDATMVAVSGSSREPSPDPSDDDADMVGVQQREPSPDPQEKDESNSTVGIEHSDPLGPMSDLSDLEEDDEGRLMNGVKSHTSVVEKKVVKSKEPPSLAKGKLPDVSDQDEESVRLAAELGLRRSARNIPSRMKSAVNYASYAPSRKSSTGRRKPAMEKDAILVEASIQIFSI
jgi:hypothetical protein